MSTPNRPVEGKEYTAQQAAYYAQSENISAQSSLNMHPDPIKCEDDCPVEECTKFLSERDGNAKHAMEHLQASFAWLSLIRDGRVYR